MSVNISGKEAITNYEVIKNYKHSSKLRLKLYTGRTHQIRVHMHYEGYPLIGDQIYGLKKGKNKNISKEVNNFSRQALHAEILELVHPTKNTTLEIKSNIPKDLNELEEILSNE